MNVSYEQRAREKGTPVPSIARMVFYYAYGTPGGEYPVGDPRPAIITGVDNPGDPYSALSLFVVTPAGFFFNHHVPHTHEPKGGCWNWTTYVPPIVVTDHTEDPPPPDWAPPLPPITDPASTAPSGSDMAAHEYDALVEQYKGLIREGKAVAVSNQAAYNTAVHEVHDERQRAAARKATPLGSVYVGSDEVQHPTVWVSPPALTEAQDALAKSGYGTLNPPDDGYVAEFMVAMHKLDTAVQYETRIIGLRTALTDIYTMNAPTDEESSSDFAAKLGIYMDRVRERARQALEADKL
jgi:hypothetical protein